MQRKVVLERKYMKKIRIHAVLFIFMMVAMLLVGCNQTDEYNIDDANNVEYAISFVDDIGNQIYLEKSCVRIISLYSAHTENLYSLGVGENVIGVNSTAIYPPDAETKSIYDYKSDPEKVIAAEPDVVIIRPFINRKSPDFVEALTNAGVTVVSLYPESFDLFDEYILKLGLICGKEDIAQEKLDEFHQNMAMISNMTHKIDDKQTVFFESTDKNLRTVTKDSMAGRGITKAGGINAAGDLEPITEGSSIASFGIEKILDMAEEIDVYVSQRGAMNAGGNLHTISIRPGFETIKAVQDENVYLINEKIISSPTFRYYKGVRELARYMYPDVMDSLDEFKVNKPATKRDFANILVRFNHKPIYIPTSSKYYKSDHSGHTYGLFEDIPWTDMDFDYIETAVLSSWITGEKKGEIEFLYPDEPVTKDMLARAIFMMDDYKIQDTNIYIADLVDSDYPNMIQILVDNGIFALDGDMFNPKAQMSIKEIVDILELVN